MIKKLHDSKFLLYFFGLLLSSVLERIISHFVIEQFFDLDPLIFHTISLVMLVVLFIFTNIILKKIINSNFAVKKILGKSYIAGRWIEVTYCPDGTHVGYCCLDITYESDGISLIGTNYDLELNVNYKLKSKSASFDDYTLNYKYERNCGGEISFDWGTLMFQQNRTCSPNLYTGRFKRDGELFRFIGFLVQGSKDLMLLDKSFVCNFNKIFEKYYKGNCKFVMGKLSEGNLDEGNNINEVSENE